MKVSFLKIALVTITLTFTSACAELSELGRHLGSGAPLTEEEVVRGLRSALEVGASRATEDASREGGFLNNAMLFIEFPEEARRVENTLRDIGMGSLVDDFILTLNRAAEQAAGNALPIFESAVRQMTIRDGFDILYGPENAATDYFRRTTSNELSNAFRPVISNALENTLATRYWKDITDAYNRLPFVQPVQTNLTDYTTTRAMNGLFTLLENEEAAIRQDPVKRTTDILKRVFGHPSMDEQGS